MDELTGPTGCAAAASRLAGAAQSFGGRRQATAGRPAAACSRWPSRQLRRDEAQRGFLGASSALSNLPR